MYDLQLRFTVGGGCNKTVFIVKNVIEYFIAYHSNVYVVSLDLSIAYDRENPCKLLMKLFGAKVPIVITLIFSNWYQIFSVLLSGSIIDLNISTCLLVLDRVVFVLVG